VDLIDRHNRALNHLIAFCNEWHWLATVRALPRSRVRLKALLRNDIANITFHERFG